MQCMYPLRKEEQNTVTCVTSGTCICVLFMQEPGETSPYPTIKFSGHTAEESGAVAVNFEGLQLTAMDIVDGFALLLAVYWTFNIQYAPKAKRTCVLLEMMLGLPPTEQMVSVVKAATALQVARRV